MQIPSLYCAPFHESANRPHLLAGCEPTAIAMALVISVVIGWSIMTWWGVGGAVLLFFFLRTILREMAKDDPYMLSLHGEAQRYNAGFWPAHSMTAKRWRL